MSSLEAINDLRARIVAGEPVSDEELAEGVKLIREDRMNAYVSAPTKKTSTRKPAKAPIDLQSLFSKPSAEDDDAKDA